MQARFRVSLSLSLPCFFSPVIHLALSLKSWYVGAARSRGLKGLVGRTCYVVAVCSNINRYTDA